MTPVSEIVGWMSLVMLAEILAIGLAWSRSWRRLPGQIDIEESLDHR